MFECSHAPIPTQNSACNSPAAAAADELFTWDAAPCSLMICSWQFTNVFIWCPQPTFKTRFTLWIEGGWEISQCTQHRRVERFGDFIGSGRLRDRPVYRREGCVILGDLFKCFQLFMLGWITFLHNLSENIHCCIQKSTRFEVWSESWFISDVCMCTVDHWLWHGRKGQCRQ